MYWDQEGKKGCFPYLPTHFCKYFQNECRELRWYTGSDQSASRCKAEEIIPCNADACTEALTWYDPLLCMTDGSDTNGCADCGADHCEDTEKYFESECGGTDNGCRTCDASFCDADHYFTADTCNASGGENIKSIIFERL